MENISLEMNKACFLKIKIFWFKKMFFYLFYVNSLILVEWKMSLEILLA